MSHSRLAALLRGLAAAAVGLTLAGNADARVPQGFIGMMADGPVLAPGVNLAHEFDVMVAAGVESVRFQINWSEFQPYASWADVPPSQAGKFEHDPVPTDFTTSDAIVELAAERGLTVLPIVVYTPGWAEAPHSPDTYGVPSSDSTYAAFLTALVLRYGPRGSFWAAHPGIPRLPIRMWQIWNEPNFSLFWPIQPFASSYVQLVHAAHDAIKKIDPGAKVILAGLPNYVWTSVEEIYSVPGASKYFDAVAVHPYTARAEGVITILQRVRDVMNRHGDVRKPIVASEVGFNMGDRIQATKAGQVLPLLASHRRELGLMGFYYYSWVDATAPVDHFGLFHLSHGRFRAKRGYSVFRRTALALEGCSAKKALATSCVKHR